MIYRFFKKQRIFLNDCLSGRLKRQNILEGSIRSGKTTVALYAFILWVIKYTEPEDNLILCAKTLNTLQVNTVNELRRIVGSDNFKGDAKSGIGKLFDRNIIFVSFSSRNAFERIHGMTIKGVYMDEMTLADYDFYLYLLGRLSAPGAKLFATTNPDSPEHWAKAKILENKNIADEIYNQKFLLTDNSFLDKSYIESIQKEYSGVFFDRYIRGEWVFAEGRVFENVHALEFDIDELSRELDLIFSFGLDFGYNDPTFFTASAIDKQNKDIYVFDEFCKTGLSIKGIYELICLKNCEKQHIISDVNPQLVAELRALGCWITSIDKLKQNKLTSIAKMQAYRIIVHPKKCPETLKSLNNYVWAKDSHGNTLEEPEHKFSHAPDAIRYAFIYNMRPGKDWLFFPR